MSAFRDAIAEWNRRLTEGWRSATAQLPCPQCHEVGVILTTIYGRTSATCPCGHSWLVVP